MLEKINIEKVLFLDIETVPLHANFGELDEKSKHLWEKKANYFLKNDEELTLEDSYSKAGIYAEFGKIVCISVGFLRQTTTGKELRIKSYANEDEETLLLDFAKLLNEHYNSPYHILCGHNGKEFDFPFIARRLLINGIRLPHILNIAGKKPWEIAHLDTMELWKFGDYKNYTSLELLTHVFGIPTPKDDIDGSMVGHVFWEEKGLDRIVKYCQKDVAATVQLFLKYKLEPLIEEGDIYYL